jgi:hypothetical protein
MRSIHQPAAGRRPLICARVPALLLPLLLLGCQPSPDGGDEGDAVPAAARIVLNWPSIEAADRYELRVWAGNRLLFEESVADTVFVLGESLRRTVLAFDSLEVVVRGMRRGERLSTEPIRWRRAAAD